MELWDYSVDRELFARVGTLAFPQCEAVEAWPVSYPRHGATRYRCGAAAMRGVSWQGMTEGMHSVLLCDAHTLAYLGPMVREA